VTAEPVFDFNGTTFKNLEKTSITVKIFLIIVKFTVGLDIQ
jgi:hypothetical protein